MGFNYDPLKLLGKLFYMGAPQDAVPSWARGSAVTPGSSSNQRPKPAGSPAPGAPGAGGAQYVSPFQGRRDANIGLLRSRGYGIPSAAGGGSTALVTGLDRGGNIDRTQSDQYRAAMGQQAPAYPSFPLTPQGQFERYFSSGSPEMDRYFGAASRGTGAPKSLEEMNTLASQSRAPMTSPLATYYRAQSAAGQGNMDEIISAMGYKGTPMEQWARSNQALAFREYNKKFPAGAPTQGPSDEAMLAARAKGQYYMPEEGPTPQIFNTAQQLPSFTGAAARAIGAASFNPMQPNPNYSLNTNPAAMDIGRAAIGANTVPAPPVFSGVQPSPEVKNRQSTFTLGSDQLLSQPISDRVGNFIDFFNKSRNMGTTNSTFGA